MLDSALFPLYKLQQNCSNSFRTEPFFQPKTTWLGLIVTQALVKCYISNTNDYYGGAPGSYVSRRLKMHIPIATLSLCLEVSQAETLARTTVYIHHKITFQNSTPPPLCRVTIRGVTALVPKLLVIYIYYISSSHLLEYISWLPQFIVVYLLTLFRRLPSSLGWWQLYSTRSRVPYG